MGRKCKGDEFELDGRGRLNIQLSGEDASEAVEAMRAWGCRTPKEFFRWFSLAQTQGAIPLPFQNYEVTQFVHPEETSNPIVDESPKYDLDDIDPGGLDADFFG